MVLGMSLATFTLGHVIISLIGIVAGLVVMFGMLGSNRQPGLTAIFLLFTILTSATGFLFPNVFVLVIQSFLKIPALTAVAPGNPPSGPVFAVVQGIVLVFFVLMIIGAWRRFKPA